MMRNFVEMFLPVRQALEFSHGQDPKRTKEIPQRSRLVCAIVSGSTGDF
jgi:hypothetical protein